MCVGDSMELNVKLEVFEGPLDLLLHLLDKNKVDIYDIPIVEITNQYMEYMTAMKEEALEVTSEFLVMAATLLDVKSRMLLPKSGSEETEEEEDPRADLVRQLLEYKLYKYMADQLREQQSLAKLHFYHSPSIPKEVRACEPLADPNQLIQESGVDLNRLYEVFQEALLRQERRIDPIRAKFGNIKREEVSVDDRIGDLRKFARTKKYFSFGSLLRGAKSRTELVVTFLAILEMMKAGNIVVSQRESFGEIEIESRLAEEQEDDGEE